ncbi:MAG: dipeptidase [Bacteroides sp.]|nr:dipeptidase [Ruminococcus flavefaciens]MCM1555625.1 dipeptidase [Bacteroides sp.]
MKDIKDYIRENKERFLEELYGLLRIPSISSEAAHKPDMQKAAEYWKEQLLKAGADKAEVMPTEGNPVVYGQKIVDPKAKTVLVYGHYDVMPVDPVELWKTEPFEPQIIGDRLYCRGANDDKGQSFMHAKAFEYMVRENCLPCNVKFMLEGEEEIGSPSLEKWCADNKEMLKADVILVSDTSMIAPDVPSITVGLRGLSYVQVKVTGPNKDLHSGIFGGAVANPANVLAGLIAGLIDENGHITVPGFYDDVLEISAEERAAMAKAPFDEAAYRKALDIEETQGEKGFSTIERTGIRPSLDVNGMWSGYTGEGAKTVLPSVAYAKISMRLVPDQNWEKIGKQVADCLQKRAPKSVKVEVELLHGGQAYGADLKSEAYKAAEQAYMDVYGKLPIPTRSGGSIPIIAAFERVLGIKSLLMGFGLEADAIHSPNESYLLDNFYRGIETIRAFYRHFGR